jgi:hypothetical protein
MIAKRRTAMLTDIPQNAIGEIHDNLKYWGYPNAQVLVEEHDDPVTLYGQRIFELSRDIVDNISKHMNLSVKIYVGLIIDQERDLQACAFQLHNDDYCILIWLATAKRIQASISRLLNTSIAAETFSADLPFPNDRAIPQVGVTFRPYIDLSMLPIAELGGKFDVFRNQLARSALEWLVLHELGHLVHGHLSTAIAVNGSTYILEQNPKNDRDKHLTDQTLEFDADCFANAYALHRALLRPLSIEPVDAVYSDELIEGRLKAYVFAVMAVVRGFDDAPFEVESLFDSDHPPGGVRMSYMLNHILKLKNAGKQDFGGINVSEIASKTTIAVERAIWEATGIQGNGGNWWQATQLHVDKFLMPVLSRWAKLYPELNAAKLTPFNLAPPQSPPA